MTSLFLGSFEGDVSLTAVGASEEEVRSLIRKAYFVERGGFDMEYSSTLLLLDEDINVRPVVSGEVWLYSHSPMSVEGVPLLRPLEPLVKEYGWVAESTGGGCTALSLELDQDFFLMMSEESQEPKACEAPVYLSFYAGNEENFSDAFSTGIEVEFDGVETLQAGEAILLVDQHIKKNWSYYRKKLVEEDYNKSGHRFVLHVKRSSESQLGN